MYDFIDFISSVKENLIKRFPDSEITVIKRITNNDVIKTALQINNPGFDLTPNIYMDYYYSKYQSGVSLGHVIDDMLGEYLKKMVEFARTPVGKSVEIGLSDTSNIFLKVINKNSNRRYLEDVPFIEFNDLAVTFRCLVRVSENEIGSVKLKNDLFESFGLKKEEMYEIANENTRRLFPPVIKKLSDILRENVSNSVYIPDNEIYVLSNEKFINGATVMLYDDVINGFVKAKGNCYIIPSSIHEIIMLPQKDFEGDEHLLKMFIRQVNTFTLTKQEFLSNNLYLADENGISVVEVMEKEDYMDM